MKKLLIIATSLMVFSGCKESVKPTPKTEEVNNDYFEIIDYQKVGFIQIRVAYDKDTKVMYTITYAVDNGGNVGGVSIQPIYNEDGSLRLYSK